MSIWTMMILSLCLLAAAGTSTTAEQDTTTMLRKKKKENGVSRASQQEPGFVSKTIVLADAIDISHEHDAENISGASENDWSIIQPPFGNEGQQGERDHRSLGGLYCTSPEEVYYKANFNLQTTYSPSRSCSATEWGDIGRLMDFHFDRFVANNQVLGPIDMKPSGASCPARRRRLDGENDDTPVSAGRGQLIRDSQNQTSLVPFADELQADQDSRDLRFRMSGYLWTGAGSCRFCGKDAADKRQRRLGPNISPVTIVVTTDSYPSEISYTIKQADGATVFTSPPFAYSHQKYTQTVYLNSDQWYKFVAADSYGDGWCCTHGNGGAQIYEGTTTTNTPRLLNMNTAFGTAKVLWFRAPAFDGTSFTNSVAQCTGTSASITTSASCSGGLGGCSVSSSSVASCDANGCSASSTTTISTAFSSSTTSQGCTAFVINSAFPQLEIDLSTYISFYVQRAHHGNSNMCLHGTYPTVSVDLTPTTKSGSMNYC